MENFKEDLNPTYLGLDLIDPQSSMIFILPFVAVAHLSCIFLDFEFYSYFPCIQEETGRFKINVRVLLSQPCPIL